MRLDYSDVTQRFLKEGRSLHEKSSLRVMLIMRTRKLQLSHANVPDQVLNDKLIAYRFIDLLGVRRPRTLASNVRHKHLHLTENVVIKPNNGYSSKGVYIVFNQNEIFKVKSGEKISNWNSLIECLGAEIASGAIKKDRWMIEELICEDDAEHTPARDLKFYCFYGRIGLVLEVRRYPETRYCFWTADGKSTATGAYEDRLFDGGGFTSEMLSMAERLSLEIPAPFMRIDFLRTKAGMFFCEFTPRPGGAWNYDQATDRILGDYYLDAEARLMTDFLHGRTFEAFNAVLKNSRFEKMAA
jgi:hypothetical protein